MGSLTICALHRCYQVDEIKENETNGVRGMHGEFRTVSRIYVGMYEEKREAQAQVNLTIAGGG